MHFNLTTPCSSCPFRTDVPFFIRSSRAREIARVLTDHGGLGNGGGGTFPCHNTVEYKDCGDARTTPKTNFCAGALIVMEKSGVANQAMRIAERLGMYDAGKLNMKAPVFGSLREFAAQRPVLQKGSKVKLAMAVKKILGEGTGLYCKDCGREVAGGAKQGAEFPYGCPNCGNKTRKMVTNKKPKRVEPLDNKPARVDCKADREVEAEFVPENPKTVKCGSCRERVKLTNKGSCTECGFDNTPLDGVEEEPEEPKEKPRSGPAFSVTEIVVSKEPKPQLCSKEDALAIFTGWWRDGLLKAELKPVQVLKVIYAQVEENSEELRIKVVALCKLANGEKRRMAAKKYQRRDADAPHYVIVEPTKKPDGDELFNDTPIGRDEFAEKSIKNYDKRKEDAKRYVAELERRERESAKKGKKRGDD